MIAISKKSGTMLRAGSLLLSGFLISAAPLATAAAQDRQPKRQLQESRSDRSQAPQGNGHRDGSWFNENEIRDDTAEGWLVTKLFARPGMNNVNVEINDGVATLSGRVADEQTKRRAVRIANSTWGVSSVRDQLTVDSSLANRRAANVAGKDLAKQVAQKIAATVDGAKAGEDWWFDGWRVEAPYNRWNVVVDVNEPGEVILDGEVPSVNLMQRIVKAAVSVNGVRTVHSDLQIDNEANRPAYGWYRWHANGQDAYRGPYAVPNGYRGPYIGAAQDYSAPAGK
jgi:hypothetical protein